MAQALKRFSGGDAWAAEHARMTAAFDRLRTDPRSPLTDRPETTARLQKMAEDWERQVRLLDQVRDDLVHRLARGELFAVGFVAMESDGCAETLQPLPPGAWQADATIDWDGSRLEVNELRYADIRVLDSLWAIEARDSDPDSLHPTVTRTLPRGRPCC